MLVWTRCFQIL